MSDTTKREENTLRPCWVNGRRALFHRWAEDARPTKPRGHENDDNCPYFQLHAIHAIVEFEDGTVAKVWPQVVQFMDRDTFDAAWLPWTMEE